MTIAYCILSIATFFLFLRSAIIGYGMHRLYECTKEAIPGSKYWNKLLPVRNEMHEMKKIQYKERFFAFLYATLFFLFLMKNLVEWR